MSKFATETMRSSSGMTSGFSCEALSSISSWPFANSSASRVGAVDLREAAERERVLEVSRGALLPEVAPFEEAADALECEAEPRIRPDVADGRMEHRQIGGERLEVHGARDVERAHEPFRVRDGERRQPRRERVRVDERDALFGEELEVFEEPGGEVCHRSEVALADRAEHVDARPFVLVQRAHDPLRDLRPYA